MTSHAVGHPFLAAAATCEKCGYHQAYFNEIQIRSADEPATLFFKCVKCGNQWREG
jgi:DNA-directed RNA polymerase III subunit RPC11